VAFIPDDKVEEVRAASDILDVVGEHVQLKRQGTNYFGLCPFHNEKSPSFSVNPSMGVYKCFGCGVAGDVFSFVTRYLHVSFPEAVRLLAQKAGIDLPAEGSDEPVNTENDEIFHALRFAGRFFHHVLTATPEGAEALKYLRSRGFSNETITRFGLGFAPDRWDALLRAADEQHIRPETLEKAGLVVPRPKGDGHYDRFRGRVIFPIMSASGNLVGFGGRILQSGSDQAKYINSPETRVYHKSEILYGLFHARQEMRRTEEVLLVEGYTDVIALHQAGIANVVSVSGTSLTTEQVKIIGRYAKRVIMLFDADAAGVGAARRSIDLALEEGLHVYGLSLPEGEDPDSYVTKNGGDGFREYARKNRRDFVAFKVDLARISGVEDSPEAAIGTARSVLESISRMPDPLARESFVRHASELLRIPDITLFEVLAEIERKRAGRSRRRANVEAGEAAPASGEERRRAIAAQPSPAEPDGSISPEESALLRLMLEHGTTMVELILGHMSVEEFSDGIARRAARALLELYQKGAVDRKAFLEGHFGDDLREMAAALLVDRHTPSENWERKRKIAVPKLNQNPEEAAIGAMVQLKLDRIRQAVAEVSREMFEAQRKGENVRSLQDRLLKLHEARKFVEARGFMKRSAS
jgi:DNA primase